MADADKLIALLNGIDHEVLAIASKDSASQKRLLQTLRSIVEKLEKLERPVQPRISCQQSNSDKLGPEATTAALNIQRSPDTATSSNSDRSDTPVFPTTAALDSQHSADSTTSSNSDRSDIPVFPTTAALDNQRSADTTISSNSDRSDVSVSLSTATLDNGSDIPTSIDAPAPTKEEQEALRGWVALRAHETNIKKFLGLGLSILNHHETVITPDPLYYDLQRGWAVTELQVIAEALRYCYACLKIFEEWLSYHKEYPSATRTSFVRHRAYDARVLRDISLGDKLERLEKHRAGSSIIVAIFTKSFCTRLTQKAEPVFLSLLSSKEPDCRRTLIDRAAIVFADGRATYDTSLATRRERQSVRLVPIRAARKGASKHWKSIQACQPKMYSTSGALPVGENSHPAKPLRRPTTAMTSSTESVEDEIRQPSVTTMEEEEMPQLRGFTASMQQPATSTENMENSINEATLISGHVHSSDAENFSAQDTSTLGQDQLVDTEMQFFDTERHFVNTEYFSAQDTPMPGQRQFFNTEYPFNGTQEAQPWGNSFQALAWNSLLNPALNTVSA